MTSKMANKQDLDGFGYVEKIPFKEDTMMFQLPFAMCIAGPSQSGKSEFIHRLLQNKEHLFPTHFHRFFIFLSTKKIFKGGTFIVIYFKC